MQFCPSCGTELPNYAHFCGHCGYSLSATVEIGKVRNMKQSFLVDARPLDDSITQNLDIRKLAVIPLPVDAYPLDSSTNALLASIPGHKVLSRLPKSVQKVIARVFTRVQDPEPEQSYISTLEAIESKALTWGWLPTLALADALGVLSIAFAYTSARNGATEVDEFFWLGLLLMFVPTVVRLISSGASRFERISLLCIASICFYLVTVMYSPLAFTNHDAFQHWSTAQDIARSGHLFSENALLPVSPFYPGLEIVTNALSTLTGLSIFYAGTLLIGVAHILMILSLYMLCERITASARIAGIASILYVTNSHFLFFDTQYIYESFALPLAAFMLFALAEHEKFKGNYRWIAWLTLGAIVVTHHVTSYMFDGLLLLWAVTYSFLHRVPLYKSNVGKTALLGIFASLVWITLKGNPVVNYLSSYVIVGVGELEHVLEGANGARHLFTDYSGQQAPLWERLMAISSLGLIVLSLPIGLLCLWQRYRSNALTCMFGIASLFFPILQVFRLTSTGYEIADRPIPFLFIPIACILAIFIAQFWPTRWLNWKHTLLITCALAVMFLGGAILGSGPPWELLPGPYLVGAHERSIEPEGIQAALWTPSHIGTNNRMAADLNNKLLMGTYGDQRLVTPEEDNVDLVEVFFSLKLDAYDLSLLQQAKVHYLVVDLRLGKALPRIGFYFDETESGAFQRTSPISMEALTKFNTIPQINRVFDSGDIILYDTGGLLNAPKIP